MPLLGLGYTSNARPLSVISGIDVLKSQGCWNPWVRILLPPVNVVTAASSPIVVDSIPAPLEKNAPDVDTTNGVSDCAERERLNPQDKNNSTIFFIKFVLKLLV